LSSKSLFLKYELPFWIIDQDYGTNKHG